MLAGRKIAFCGVAIVALTLIPTLESTNAADTTSQVMTNIEEILKANPLKAGEKAQMINVAQDSTMTLFVVRATRGYLLKPHLHKTHDETVYVIKGAGQMLINDHWIDIKPGSLHFNPTGKIHSIKQTGNKPLVALSIFTPSLTEPDRQFVQ